MSSNVEEGKPVMAVIEVPAIDDAELQALSFVLAAMQRPYVSNPGRERIAAYIAARFGVEP